MTTTEKVRIGIIAFGIVLAIVCTSLFVWSMTRPPVTSGPTLDKFEQQVR